MRRYHQTLGPAAAALAAVIALAGCGGGSGPNQAGSSPAPVPDPGFGHVHGLDINPADGLLYAATHYGVWRVPTKGKPVRVADRYQDTMGFTITGPDRFLGSGHPDLRERLPSHLGLIESRDRAQTWTPLSLLGEADFHALEAKHDRIYGYDSTSSTFMVSADGKEWQRLAQLALHDFTVAPSQPDVVLGGGEGGLVRSDDGGKTFTAVPGAPQIVFVDWSAAGLYGLDAAGVMWTSTDGGTTWERTGELGSQPGALTVTETGQLFAADDEGVVTSQDGGHTFTPVVSYSPTTHGYSNQVLKSPTTGPTQQASTIDNRKGLTLSIVSGSPILNYSTRTTLPWRPNGRRRPLSPAAHGARGPGARLPHAMPVGDPQGRRRRPRQLVRVLRPDTGGPLTAGIHHADAYVRVLDELGDPRTKRQLSAASVSRRVSAVAGLYRFAVRQRAITKSPFFAVERPGVDDESRRPDCRETRCAA